MIRSIEEKDIPVILDWYNWYIRNSTATFETEELTLNEFKQRVHKITETNYELSIKNLLN